MWSTGLSVAEETVMKYIEIVYMVQSAGYLGYKYDARSGARFHRTGGS
jgi:hypothetical protein